MNKTHITIIAIGILCLALATIYGMAKVENNKVNMLWPEGRVLSK